MKAPDAATVTRAPGHAARDPGHDMKASAAANVTRAPGHALRDPRHAARDPGHAMKAPAVATAARSSEARVPYDSVGGQDCQAAHERGGGEESI